MDLTDRRDPSSVTVIVYHACPTGASGSALGPHELVTYWWVERGRIRLVGDAPARGQTAAVEEAVLVAIRDPADVVRAAQDAAAESPV